MQRGISGPEKGEGGSFFSLQRLAFPFCLGDFPLGLGLMKLFSLPFFDSLNFLLNWGRCVTAQGSWKSPEELLVLSPVALAPHLNHL